MLTPLAVLVGKALRFVLRLRGGGSAVPGRAALLIEPRFLQKTLGRMSSGIYFVSGSNGKSTTTAMLVKVLREHGLCVLSNPAGGNLPQGLASALLADVDWLGRLQHDVAILEVDEAYGKLIAAKVAPNGLLLTNIQLDQLNRFHSPEEVFDYLDELANLTTGLIVVNGTDANTERLAKKHSHRLKAKGVYVSPKALKSAAHGILAAPDFNEDNSNLPVAATLASAKGISASIALGDKPFAVTLPAPGLHYAVDAALAIAFAKEILGVRFSQSTASKAVSELPAVYGRGEIIEYQGQKLEIIMMKNLPSLQANLDALETSPKHVWISVDEGTPDPSWIYDIALGKIDHVDVVSGTKTYQWATRLAYAGIKHGKLIESESEALEYFLGLPGKEKTAIVNYEQMMWLRKKLGLLDLEGGNG
ncbi:MAG: UDP-N-acetylmuramyl tripeptide synthetase [Actinomycetota bacterium]|jgi:UDP-N-acetylmuramyl tripeptide synthase